MGGRKKSKGETERGGGEKHRTKEELEGGRRRDDRIVRGNEVGKGCTASIRQGRRNEGRKREKEKGKK